MKNKKYKITDEDFAKMRKVSKKKEIKDDKKHFYLSFNIRILFCLVLAIIMIGMSYYCFKYSFTNGEKDEIKYDIKGNVDYKVNLKDGNVFSDGTLEVGDSYLSDYIDNLDIEFDYSYYLSKEVEYKYSYYIDGLLYVNDKDNQMIGKNTYNLVDKKEFNNTGFGLDIKEKINLDYEKYNSLISELQSDYDLNGYLLLKLHVLVEGLDKKFNNKIGNEDVVTFKVPLFTERVAFSNKDSKIKTEGAYKETIDPVLNNRLMLYAGIILLILVTVMLICIANYVMSTLPVKSKYCVLRDGILKDYKKIIVSTRKMPSIKGKNVISCYSFQELYDAQKLLEKPIIYYEVNKDIKSMFFIVDENDIYEYVLKECDVDY